MKAKKCRICKTEFTPTRIIQPTCESFDCKLKHGLEAAQKSRLKRLKHEAKLHREAKVKAKTRSQWIKEAQAVVNKWIRLRDTDQTCISCGRHHTGQYHAGHYMATSIRPSLRFDERNIYKQCQPCNMHLHGNLIEYRKRLIEKKGIELVEWLEGRHEPKKYTIDELKQIIAEYKLKLKELI